MQIIEQPEGVTHKGH